MFYVYQSGFEGKYCKTEVEVVAYICSLFGWTFINVYEKIFLLLETLRIRGKHYCIHEDLALYVHRF